jgi:hypothetical protein
METTMTNGFSTGDPTGTLRAVSLIGTLALLFCFGIGFNWLVGWLKVKRPLFPASILVVMGVIVTCLGAWLLDHVAGWGVLVSDLAAFAASGLAMIAGDLWRSTAAAEESARDLRRRAEYNYRLGKLFAEVDNVDETPAVAEEGE